MRPLVAAFVALVLPLPSSGQQTADPRPTVGASPRLNTPSFRGADTARLPGTRPISNVSARILLPSRKQDLTGRDRKVLGSLHLLVGAIGLGGGVFSGIGTARVLSSTAESELAEVGKIFAGTLLVNATVSFLATGVYMTIQGIRILRGEDPSVGWGSQPFPSPPPRVPPPSLSQHGPPVITISL